jgi:hypothetical protein
MKVIGSYAVRLNAPPGIYNMFHVILLRKAANNSLLLQVVYEPQPLALNQNDGSEEYEIEKILNHAFSGNKHKTLKLLIK